MRSYHWSKSDVLSVKVVVQEHVFVDHFKGNLQLHFSLNVASKFSISHALFKHPR